VGIYNRDSASCAFTLTSQFDAGVDLVKAGAKLSGSVTVRATTTHESLSFNSAHDRT
jgi:hypothetical protein